MHFCSVYRCLIYTEEEWIVFISPRNSLLPLVGDVASTANVRHGPGLPGAWYKDRLVFNLEGLEPRGDGKH